MSVVLRGVKEPICLEENIPLLWLAFMSKDTIFYKQVLL